MLTAIPQIPSPGPNFWDQLFTVGGPAVAIILALGVVIVVVGKTIWLPSQDKRSKATEIQLEATLAAKDAAAAAHTAAVSSQAAAQNALSAAEMSHQTVMKVIERINAN